MKVLSVSLQNFSSYKSLDFDFTNQGLTLIEGPTGSGKSTLCDAIPWILFGRTAKGGAVDEVLSWPGNETCIGTITLDLDITEMTITRARGSKSKDNDLFFRYAGPPEQIRGKDLLDSQKLINNVLGLDYDLYLAGAYYHEFSQTAQFFSTTAKSRRTICEQLVDLSLSIKLRDGISEKRKFHTISIREINSKIQQLESNIDLLQRLQGAESTKAENWEINHKYNKAGALESYEYFEKRRDRVVSNKCNACGTILNKPTHIHNDSPNPYKEAVEALESAVNPHTGATKDYTAEIDNKTLELTYLNQELVGLNTLLGDLDALDIVTNDLRSNSISNTIKYLESSTNDLLTKYFDSEIRVAFEAAAADKVEVEIQKDGNLCSYTQLSKGQRCLLKLCFGVSVMQAVSNYHGITFNQIFLDEAFDGMSDEFKTKSYRLLETLTQSYDNIFVVEHSEALKSLFANKYSVELIAGNSNIAKIE